NASGSDLGPHVSARLFVLRVLRATAEGERVRAANACAASGVCLRRSTRRRTRARPGSRRVPTRARTRLGRPHGDPGVALRLLLQLLLTLGHPGSDVRPERTEGACEFADRIAYIRG